MLTHLISDLFSFYSTHEPLILYIGSVTSVVVGFVCFLLLLYRPVAYGRHSSGGWVSTSLSLPPRTAWFLQELPAFLIPTLMVALSAAGVLRETIDATQLAVLSMFLVHYFNRTFIYALSIKGGKNTPIIPFLLAFIFCTGNGVLQERCTFTLVNVQERDYLRVFLGSCLYVVGFLTNLHSDHVLRNLRKPGEVGYKIPKGGLFCLVSCANYTGEILEWLGYAVAANHHGAYSFAFFTAANLVPRAIHHHRWYIEKFEDYPANRKAVIPYVL